MHAKIWQVRLPSLESVRPGQYGLTYALGRVWGGNEPTANDSRSFSNTIMLPVVFIEFTTHHHRRGGFPDSLYLLPPHDTLLPFTLTFNLPNYRVLRTQTLAVTRRYSPLAIIAVKIPQGQVCLCL